METGTIGRQPIVSRICNLCALKTSGAAPSITLAAVVQKKWLMAGACAIAVGAVTHRQHRKSMIMAVVVMAAVVVIVVVVPNMVVMIVIAMVMLTG